jgi:hypothetical protein
MSLGRGKLRHQVVIRLISIDYAVYLLVNLINMLLVAPVCQDLLVVYPARVYIWHALHFNVLVNKRKRACHVRHTLSGVYKLLLNWT